LIKNRLPSIRVRFDGREGVSYPLPGILDGFVHKLVIWRLKPVFHIPDFVGNVCGIDQG
jgi:hypothetical protein